MSGTTARTLLLERERIDGISGRDGHELTAINGVAHWGRRHIRPCLKMPQMRAGLRVERDEIAVADCREQHIACGREHTGGQRSLKHLEVPHRLSCLGI